MTSDSTSWRVLWMFMLAALALTAGRPASAAPPTAVPSSATGTACQALLDRNFRDLPEAETTLLTAAVVPAAGDLPAVCKVAGKIPPAINFEVLLPLTGWNGKYLQTGSAAMGGFMPTSMMCGFALRRGYACAGTDTGHVGGPFDGAWAKDNIQAVIDFGYRAAHVTAIAAKAVTGAFYGKAPRLSYFYGTSTGGTNALSEAQRYPEDFNGIVAGAPGPYFTGIVMHYLWAGRALRGSDGNSLLTIADAEFLHTSVIAACDMDDGVKDGVLADPQSCGFRPQTLLCKAQQRTACLTQAQLVAVLKVYQGPVNSRGEAIYTGGMMKGSERNWIRNDGSAFITEKASMGPEVNLADNITRWFSFFPARSKDWNGTEFDFDTDPQRLATIESIVGASNPDLRKFKASGGKLLMFQGLNDESDIPSDSIDYYDQAVRTMGGEGATKAFFRFFVVPGMNHAVLGDGAWAVDWFGALEAWVEKGEVPERLVAVHPRQEIGMMDALHVRLDGLEPAFTRPVFAYPVRAVYSGKGDPRDAGNFVPVRP